MEEVKVWKEVQQQQQMSTNEVPGSHYKPILTDIARGRLCCVYDYVFVIRLMWESELACARLGASVNTKNGRKMGKCTVITEYYEVKEQRHCSLS